MNTPSKLLAMSDLPFSFRQQMDAREAFGKLCDQFVSANLGSNVGQVIEVIRNSGQYDDELSGLDAAQNFVGAAENEGVVFVHDTGMDEYYYFSWQHLESIKIDSVGDCYIDVAAFAQNHGLKLDEWAWDRLDDKAVLKSAIGEDFDGDVDQPLLEAIGEFEGEFGPVVESLERIARHQGLTQLADELKGQNPSQMEKLFGDYVDSQWAVAPTSFSTKDEAARAACREFGIEPEQREALEYWQVSEYLASLLAEKGRLVCNDLAGLCVWGRETSGQRIVMDGVIREIVQEECAEEMDALIRAEFPHLGSNDERLKGVDIDMLAALEEGRVRVRHTTYPYANREVHDVAVLARGPQEAGAEIGWLVQPTGEKLLSTPGEPVPLPTGKNAGGGDVTLRMPSQEMVDSIASDLARYYELNSRSELFVAPERFEERLAAISPKFAQRIQPNSSQEMSV